MDLTDLAIIDVEPVKLERRPSFATWPCASCESWHDVNQGFAVSHYDAGRVRKTYVCSTCAVPYLDLEP